MPEDLIIRHCAPTLAGLKTGNIFTASYDSELKLDQEITRLNAVLERKGLKVVRLRARNGRALIYVYRPGQLQTDLDRMEAREILEQFGYTSAPAAGLTGIGESAGAGCAGDAGTVLPKLGAHCRLDQEGCVSRLMQRISCSAEFPHEIGLFLGYPPEDVKGFIECGGRDCKACGYWKVYGDVSAAEECFRKFTKCTGVYLKCLQRGMPFEKLAVRKGAIA